MRHFLKVSPSSTRSISLWKLAGAFVSPKGPKVLIESQWACRKCSTLPMFRCHHDLVVSRCSVHLIRGDECYSVIITHISFPTLLIHLSYHLFIIQSYIHSTCHNVIMSTINPYPFHLTFAHKPIMHTWVGVLVYWCTGILWGHGSEQVTWSYSQLRARHITCGMICFRFVAISNTFS